MKISRFFWLLLMLVPSVAFATGQESDVIYIDGQKWWLMGRLTHALDSARYYKLAGLLPKLNMESTANWDGYVGYWSLDGDLLVLDSIVVEVYEDSTYKESHTEPLPQSTMHEVFGDYYRNGRIEATFVTANNIRAAQGEMISYEHMGWARNYETELVFNVEEGRVTKRDLYHNRIVVEGFRFDDMDNEGLKKLKEDLYPLIREFHELDTINKFYVMINHWEFDSLGNMTDVDIKVHYFQHMDVLPDLALRLKQYLMAIHPWRLWYINGEYRPLNSGWSIPFRNKEWL